MKIQWQAVLGVNGYRSIRPTRPYIRLLSRLVRLDQSLLFRPEVELLSILRQGKDGARKGGCRQLVIIRVEFDSVSFAIQCAKPPLWKVELAIGLGLIANLSQYLIVGLSSFNFRSSRRVILVSSTERNQLM
jgi:hypothetical protein